MIYIICVREGSKGLCARSHCYCDIHTVQPFRFFIYLSTERILDTRAPRKFILLPLLFLLLFLSLSAEKHQLYVESKNNQRSGCNPRTTPGSPFWPSLNSRLKSLRCILQVLLLLLFLPLLLLLFFKNNMKIHIQKCNIRLK